MRLTTSLALSLVLGGCSTCDVDVQAAADSSDAADSGPSGVSAVDRCFDTCDRQHAASAATFDAMDDCSEAKCRGDEPIEPQPCAAIDEKKITYNYDEVDDCIASRCCAEATACADDPDCAAASACYDTCVALDGP